MQTTLLLLVRLSTAVSVLIVYYLVINSKKARKTCANVFGRYLIDVRVNVWIELHMLGDGDHHCCCWSLYNILSERENKKKQQNRLYWIHFIYKKKIIWIIVEQYMHVWSTHLFICHFLLISMDDTKSGNDFFFSPNDIIGRCSYSPMRKVAKYNFFYLY